MLFGRLYESVRGSVDELAEKMVGYLGVGSVDLIPQVEIFEMCSESWSSIDCLHRRGLQSESDLQDTVKKAYDAIRGAQAMTLGLDDWLMALANSQETNTYLLQQALSGKKFANEEDEALFNKDPLAREVRELAESRAISNLPEIAAEASKEDNLDLPRAKAIEEAREAPPSPTEIMQESGGSGLGTLNRLEVKSALTMSSWKKEITAAAHELVYRRGGSLTWDKSRKTFSEDMSMLPRGFRLQNGISILSPSGNSMLFSNPVASRDREGETTHWILSGGSNLKLIVWND
jgi:hypothetical protein